MPGITDPSSATRPRAFGFKGAARVVTLDRDETDPTLLLDSGLDSVAIASLPDGAWARGSTAQTVHVHDSLDETLLVNRGSGTVFHGRDPARILATRFEQPVVIVVPAGAWHQVLMDDAVLADGYGFFTAAGTVVERFAAQMAMVTRATVRFTDLPIVHPERVAGRPFAPHAGVREREDGEQAEAPPAEARPPDGDRDVLILPFEAPPEGQPSCPLDTGRDSLFIMATPPGTGADDQRPARPVPVPEVVDVHSHPDVDEYIILAGGSGDILNGPTPEAVSRTPFRGPCLLVMPAGGLHRVAMAEEHPAHPGPILIYADRRAVVPRHEVIVQRTRVAALEGTRKELDG